MGARIDRPGTELRDFQTAQLEANDKGWTTRGVPECRAGGAGTYKSPHIRQRYYRADALVTVALRFAPVGEEPTLPQITTALASPARPLFFGRKPCLPSCPVLVSETPTEAASVLEALRNHPLAPEEPKTRHHRAIGSASIKIIVPPNEGAPKEQHRLERVTDHRDWISGVHTGESRLHVFSLPRASFPASEGALL